VCQRCQVMMLRNFFTSYYVAELKGQQQVLLFTMFCLNNWSALRCFSSLVMMAYRDCVEFTYATIPGSVSTHMSNNSNKLIANHP
jgi:hypothetical protein